MTTGKLHMPHCLKTRCIYAGKKPNNGTVVQNHIYPNKLAVNLTVVQNHIYPNKLAVNLIVVQNHIQPNKKQCHVGDNEFEILIRSSFPDAI